MESPLDIAVIGAGAAGLMAAIAAGRELLGNPDARVGALDGATKLGAKILVAGGGRCNVTHDVVFPDDYNGTSRNAIARILRTFTVEDTIRFFADLGVTLKREDTGKLFPITDRAQSVLDALLAAADNARVQLLTDHRVTAVHHDGTLFQITTSKGDLFARRIIFATGGKSLPKTGSDGFGYTLAQSLGHTITTTTPALVPLVLEENHWLTRLSGIALNVNLSVRSGTGKILERHSGSMLLTHFGLSGPVVLDISRHWIAAKAADSGAMLAVDWITPLLPPSAGSKPADPFDMVDRLLTDAGRRKPRETLIHFMVDLFPSRLAEALIVWGADLPKDQELGHLSKDHRRNLVRALTTMPLPVARDRGYLFAEVTAGGVPLNEIDVSLMQSRKNPAVYLCGEILDVDGKIGGYNFQWAWASGRLAGQSAARSLAKGSD